MSRRDDLARTAGRGANGCDGLCRKREAARSWVNLRLAAQSGHRFVAAREEPERTRVVRRQDHPPKFFRSLATLTSALPPAAPEPASAIVAAPGCACCLGHPVHAEIVPMFRRKRSLLRDDELSSTMSSGTPTQCQAQRCANFGGSTALRDTNRVRFTTLPSFQLHVMGGPNLDRSRSPFNGATHHPLE